MAVDGQQQGQLAGLTIRPGFHVLPGQGHALAVETDTGGTRASEIRPYVSKACLRSSARMLDNGSPSWTSLP